MATFTAIKNRGGGRGALRGDFYHRKGLLSGGKGSVYDPEYESDIKPTVW